jgi:hypothetical protein
MVLAVSGDPFSESNNRARARAIVDARKAAGKEVADAAKQRMAERAKPKPTDLPHYRPKWSLQ